ncbi:MAG: 5'/3'-nucleotidase SurE [Verrucomicrobia bacterium]|nr:5'/3'-nucleotidase SurE [Verrucomicrobiota bacterium]
MRILLSNDDGIHAPGIRALYDAVKDLGDVFVVAPSVEQSAVGHAITVFDPIKCKRITKDGAFEGYAVGGTPADCIKLAVTEILDGPPDLVLSGINLGPNTGISVIYSGTVSAATEGTVLGIPSIAFSLDTFSEPRWDTAAAIARKIVIGSRENGIPDETLLNVNIPNLPLDEIKGCAVTLMGRSRWIEKFHKRNDPRGNHYFWLDGEMEQLDNSEGTDIRAVADGFVSITPIGLDLTRYEAVEELQKWEL